eukprot:CFRG6123T1
MVVLVGEQFNTWRILLLNCYDELTLKDGVSRLHQKTRGLMAKPVTHERINIGQLPSIHALFDLWDHDKDGLLSLQELAMGLSKFQPTADISNIIVQASATLMEYDVSHTRSLDRVEFTALVVNLADTADAPIEEIVDFLLLQSSIKADVPMEVAAVAELENKMLEDVRKRQESLL